MLAPETDTPIDLIDPDDLLRLLDDDDHDVVVPFDEDEYERL